MNMERIAKTSNCELSMANAVHLEVERLYNNDAWQELTEQQKEDVIIFVIASKKADFFKSKLFDFDGEQFEEFNNMLNRLIDEETD